MHLCFTAPSPLILPPSPCTSLCTSTKSYKLPRRHRIKPICKAETTPPSSPEDRSEETDKSPSEEHDIPSTTVDWNSEWAKFTEGGMRTMAPRGREPVSKEQLMASRAMGKFRSVSNQLPTRQQLFRDWRFWVAIIASLSLFSAFVQSSQNAGLGVGYGTI